MAIKHPFVSQVEDGTDTTLVRPSNWNAAHTIEDGTVLIPPAGTAEWKDRTYTGWELVTTATTYTVGSGGDFATLAAAAASLQGLILVANLTVQLLEKVTLTADVSFKGMISAGGRFNLDLNNFDLEISDGCAGGLYIYGAVLSSIFTNTGTSSIKMVATSLNPPNYMVNCFEGGIMRLDGVSNALTIDANSKAYRASVRAYHSQIYGRTAIWANESNLTWGGAFATDMSHIGFATNEPTTVKALRGGIVVRLDGSIIAEGSDTLT